MSVAVLMTALVWTARPASAQEAAAPADEAAAPADEAAAPADEAGPADEPAAAEAPAPAPAAEAPAAAPAAEAPAPAESTVDVIGVIVSQTSGEPLPGATVMLAGTDRAAISDENGRFVIPGVAPGTYAAEVSLMGYLSAATEVLVVAGGSAETTIQLADDPQYSEVIVMVGARTERATTQTPVPVDIITAEKIEESGQTETNLILATVAPSYSASHQTIADGSDHVIPASLRGLGPDQVLVLVNGKRRHSSALVHVNGTFGRGTVGVDLNAIPTGAIERIEVLRDGAAAQYGSDAIAGVINIVLKDNVDIGDISARSGITAEGDGFELKVGANHGVRLGRDAVFNITGEFLQRNPTDRSGEWTGSFYPEVAAGQPTEDALAARGLTPDDVSMRIGQSQATLGSTMFNLELPMAALEVYSFGGVTYRDGEAAGFYRRPEQTERVDLDYYPNGFLPEIHTSIFDWSLGAGARLDLAGLDVDVSATHGGNTFDFRVENSNNASLGVAAGGTEFDAGGTLFHQTSLNADVIKTLPVAAVEKLSLVGGAELRIENFRIEAGEETSYILGPETYVDADGVERNKAPGAQVFPGYSPDSVLSEYRTAAAAYVGAESEITERVLLDVGGRFENYSDFGNTAIGKVATRVKIVDRLALRGAVSTGFRAPSLHQVWFNTISTQFVENPDTGDLEPKQVLTANNQSDVAAAFGMPRLEEETSLNLSAGVTAQPFDGLSLTADAYRIAIDDRIVLSGRFSSAIPGVAEILAPFPDVSQAQFFVNAVDTETLGVDLVLDYALRVGASKLGVTGSTNFTRTRVVDRNVPQTVADALGGGDLDAVRDVIFNREEESRLEVALPRRKGTFAVRYGLGPASILGRARYYGPVRDRIANEDFDAKTVFDVDVGYKLPGGVKLSVGGTNILNTFPDKNVDPVNRFNEQFIYSRRVSQFGVNGGFYYVQLQYLL